MSVEGRKNKIILFVLEFPNQVGGQLHEAFWFRGSRVQPQLKLLISSASHFPNQPVGGGCTLAPGDTPDVVTADVLAQLVELDLVGLSQARGTILQFAENEGEAGLLAHGGVDGSVDRNSNARSANAKAEGKACRNFDNNRIGNASFGPNDVDRDGGRRLGCDTREIEAPSHRRDDFQSKAGQPGFAVIDDQTARQRFAGDRVFGKIESEFQTCQHQAIDKAGDKNRCQEQAEQQKENILGG